MEYWKQSNKRHEQRERSNNNWDEQNNWQDGRLQHKILIVTYNENGVNTWIKRQRLTVWMKRQGLTICCLQETHFKFKDRERLKSGERHTVSCSEAGRAISIALRRIHTKQGMLIKIKRDIWLHERIKLARRCNKPKFLCTS